MEFAIAKSVLQEEMGKLTGIIEKKPTIPILGFIKVETTDAGLRLSATDMESWIFSEVSSKQLAVTQPGVMMIPAKQMSDLVRLAPDGPIKVTLDNNGWIRVLAKNCNFRIPSVAPDGFPDPPSWEHVTWLELPSKTVKTILPMVKNMMAQDDSRLNLRGIKLEIVDGQLTMVATDGHRIIVGSSQLDGMMLDDITVLLPAQGIDELVKLIPDDGNISIAFDDDNLFFSLGTRILTTRLLAVKFPGYKAAFGNIKYCDLSCSFKADYLSQAVKRAMLCADREKGDSAAISLLFESGKLKLNAASAELGEANNILESNFSGDDPFKVYFNGKYLLDFLDPAGSETVGIQFKDTNSQAYLTSERDGCSFFYCCMPMRG